MAHHFVFHITLILCTLVVTGRGQSSCGGVLETGAGVINFSPVDQNDQTTTTATTTSTETDPCIWIVKRPVKSKNIRFQLNQIPPSSHLNFYSSENHIAGEYTIFPIESLTSSDVGSTITINGSTVVVVWTPAPAPVPAPSVDNRDDDSKPFLSLTWESQVKSGQQIELELVGAVNYMEGNEGLFSWVKPGESEQTLLWALNTKSKPFTPLALTIETEFEECEWIDPCLCSYFGVYEVYDNSLRAISTDCSRSSNLQVPRVRSHLIALAFVNPEFRRDTNHVTLTWKAGEPEEEVTTTTTTRTTEQPNCSPGYPKSCSEIQNESGLNSSQSQSCVIYPNGPDASALEVLCDFETDGGGWTVIQKRSVGPRDEFYRGWDDYVRGFGSVQGNFWLGLENIHTLTIQTDQELWVDLEDWEGNKAYAKYSTFLVSHALDFYRLSVGGYSGDAGDSMTESHNGMMFSTKDNDRDTVSNGTCATSYHGGWWFNTCFSSHLNGYYRAEEETVPYANGIMWSKWKGMYYSLPKAEMKIRSKKPID